MLVENRLNADSLITFSVELLSLTGEEAPVTAHLILRETTVFLLGTYSFNANCPVYHGGRYDASSPLSLRYLHLIIITDQHGNFT